METGGQWSYVVQDSEEDEAAADDQRKEEADDTVDQEASLSPLLGCCRRLLPSLDYFLMAYRCM